MSFSSTYILLEQEGFVTRSCVCAGLTELRNANLGEEGRYYTGFFQMAIGVERMAKLALILDHMASHSLAAPGQQAIRSFGHDLVTLFSKVAAAAHARGYVFSGRFSLSSPAKQILEFLSEFAKAMRYANLDALATGTRQKEPVHEWQRILETAMAADVPQSKQRNIACQSAAIASAIQSNSTVIASDLDKKPLTTTTWFSTPRLYDEAARFVIWELVQFLGPLRDFIVAAGNNAAQLRVGQGRTTANVPDMSEFYEFLWVDRNYVLRKKRWP